MSHLLATILQKFSFATGLPMIGHLNQISENPTVIFDYLKILLLIFISFSIFLLTISKIIRYYRNKFEALDKTNPSTSYSDKILFYYSIAFFAITVIIGLIYEYIERL